ncbi:MAG TPA: hypothetical protein VHZ78_07890 [Rhizomicrobium sp.]|jgi:hypothetical protein|nr:hypothetical protein [Rhizomicrobium sp.]
MKGAAALAGMLALGAASCASAKPPAADPNLRCTFTHPATSVHTLKALPVWLRGYIHDQIGPMADAGETFNATDVVSKPAPFNRFIRGGKIGAYWYIWFEHGGFASWRQIDVVAPPNAGGRATLADTTNRLDGPTMCTTTDRIVGKLLHGKR